MPFKKPLGPLVRPFAGVDVPPGQPVMLAASVTLQPNSVGTPNIEALRAPGHMEIDAISITAKSTTSETVILPIVGVQLSIGKLRMAERYVPISALDRGYGAASKSMYLRFDHPVYVPACEVLRADFEHSGGVSESVVVNIVYHGRLLPKSPTSRLCKFPWMASFACAVGVGAEQKTFTSTENDLANKTGVRVSVERFSSAVLRQMLVGDEQWVESAADPFLDRVYFTAYSSGGKRLIPTETPYRSVFNRRLEWEAKHVLEACEHHIFTVRYADDLFDTLVGGASGLGLSTIVLMQGWREVSL